ncbi:hypothetical protein, partial [Pectobacterium versatile]|uniref:hypothetical protein n=1 Tax=Pectobacterium versatile TaxID=2488639 RepID=UPI001F2ABEF9
LFRLKKSMYPLKENHPPQHERIKIKTEYMKKNGLFILTTTGSPPIHEKAYSYAIFTLYKERCL